MMPQENVPPPSHLSWSWLLELSQWLLPPLCSFRPCRLFSGFGAWMSVDSRHLRAARANIPFQPGLYEWGAVAPGGITVTAFYLGKAGKGISVGACVNWKLRSQVIIALVWGVGDRAKQRAIGQWPSLVRWYFSVRAEVSRSHEEYTSATTAKLCARNS